MPLKGCPSGNERAAALFQPWTAPDGFGAPRRSRPTASAAENNHMKYFLNSVAIAAVLAITVPALAQTSPSPRPARPKTVHGHAGHASAHHRGHAGTAGATTRVRTGGASSSDNVANQLNGQELQRLDASSAPAPMPMPPPSAARPAPGLSTSSGTYIPPSPRGPVSNASSADEGPKTSGGGYIAAPTGPMPMPSPLPAGTRPSGH